MSDSHEVGDRVKVINNTDVGRWLETNAEHTVQDVTGAFVRVNGDPEWFHASRFMKVADPGPTDGTAYVGGAPDVVNHPPHYTSHPSGVECITVTEHMGFNLGNAIKYIWRADLKNDAIEDLKKSRFYIERELRRRGHDGTL